MAPKSFQNKGITEGLKPSAPCWKDRPPVSFQYGNRAYVVVAGEIGLPRATKAPTPEPAGPASSREEDVVTEQVKQTVFSGVAPSGAMHLGGYLGAFRNWVALQDDDAYDVIYCIVDLHAMTVPYDPTEFLRLRLDTAKVVLALGIDPDRSLLYMQSQVPQHAELAWILGTLTPTGVLNRMTQHKDKVDKGVPSNLGLYSYPVLMAADILLFHAGLVPVGDDQKQHLEMSRDLAARFNNRFGEVFPIPEPLIPKTAARVMSLVEPTAKMSKSDPNPKNRIDLDDSPDVIRKKVKSAVTDSDPTSQRSTKPGVTGGSRRRLPRLSLLSSPPYGRGCRSSTMPMSPASSKKAPWTPEHVPNGSNSR